jgi:RND superfamily putative drug exporter
LMANMPVLLFCIAFGLSMDYEVFLLSRIREYWLASGQTGTDNDEAVALGLARTGRVVTAAALVMSISFAALIPAQVSFIRMFGVGLTLAVLVDATLVRMLLVPAFMHVLGSANWWAPKPVAPALRHQRGGCSAAIRGVPEGHSSARRSSLRRRSARAGLGRSGVGSKRFMRPNPFRCQRCRPW